VIVFLFWRESTAEGKVKSTLSNQFFLSYSILDLSAFSLIKGITIKSRSTVLIQAVKQETNQYVRWNKHTISKQKKKNNLTIVYRLSGKRLVIAGRQCIVRAGTCRTWLVNMLVLGSLMPALVGGLISTLMTSKAILFVHKTEAIFSFKVVPDHST